MRDKGEESHRETGTVRGCKREKRSLWESNDLLKILLKIPSSWKRKPEASAVQLTASLPFDCCVISIRWQLPCGTCPQLTKLSQSPKCSMPQSLVRQLPSLRS